MSTLVLMNANADGDHFTRGGFTTISECRKAHRVRTGYGIRMGRRLLFANATITKVPKEGSGATAGILEGVVETRVRGFKARRNRAAWVEGANGDSFCS